MLIFLNTRFLKMLIFRSTRFLKLFIFRNTRLNPTRFLKLLEPGEDLVAADVHGVGPSLPGASGDDSIWRVQEAFAEERGSNEGRVALELVGPPTKGGAGVVERVLKGFRGKLVVVVAAVWIVGGRRGRLGVGLGVLPLGFLVRHVEDCRWRTLEGKYFKGAI